MVTRMPSSTCKGCGKVSDAATSPREIRQPNPGDFSVCLYCGYLAAFADDLTVRDLTDKEMYLVAGNPRILEVQRARARIMKNHKQ